LPPLRTTARRVLAFWRACSIIPGEGATRDGPDSQDEEALLWRTIGATLGGGRRPSSATLWRAWQRPGTAVNIDRGGFSETGSHAYRGDQRHRPVLRSAPGVWAAPLQGRRGWRSGHIQI